MRTAPGRSSTGESLSAASGSPRSTRARRRAQPAPDGRIDPIDYRRDSEPAAPPEAAPGAASAAASTLPVASARAPSRGNTRRQLPWGHITVLLGERDDRDARDRYAARAAEHGWSHNVLTNQITNGTLERIGVPPTDFAGQLAPADSYLARELGEDPYVFDFLDLTEQVSERELEQALWWTSCISSAEPVAASDADACEWGDPGPEGLRCSATSGKAERTRVRST
jgi:hypothetical protein